MNVKTVLILSVVVAALAAAVSGVVITGNRATEARSAQAAAEAAERRAASEAKRSANEAATAASRAETRTRDAKVAEENRRAKEAEAEAAKAEAEAEASRAEARKAEAAIAEAEARKASDVAAAEKAKAEAAKAEAKKAKAVAEAQAAEAEAKAQRAADELALEQRRTEAVIAEAKALELRKIDFETAERELVELSQELDARERALRPDATIYNSSNVTWVADHEADVIGGVAKKGGRVAPEDDPTLPPETRALARAESLRRRELAVGHQAATNAVTRRLTRLYENAVRENRVVDAAYYRKALKSLYQNWEPQVEEKKK